MALGSLRLDEEELSTLWLITLTATMVAMMNMTPHAEIIMTVIMFTLKLSPKFQEPTEPKNDKSDDVRLSHTPP